MIIISIMDNYNFTQLSVNWIFRVHFVWVSVYMALFYEDNNGFTSLVLELFLT